MYYIFSTMSASVNYTHFEDKNGIYMAKKSVLIKGGANVAQEGDMGKIYTPLGVCTAINDEDYEFLKSNPTFQAHEEAGFIHVDKIDNSTIETKEAQKEIEESVSQKHIEDAIKNINSQDASAPKTPKTLPTKQKRLGDDE